MLRMRTAPQHTGDDPRTYSNGRWGTRVSGGGECYQESAVDPITGERIWVRITTADPDSEFPTDWHREAHIAALRRELTGARNAAASLAAMDQADRDSIMKSGGGPSRVEDVARELARLGETE